MKQLSNDIWAYKVLSEEQCNFIINTFEEVNQWENAWVVGDVPDYRKTLVTYITQLSRAHSSAIMKAHNDVAYAYVKALEEVKRQYTYGGEQSHMDYCCDEGFQLFKYPEGYYYKEHVDHGIANEEMQKRQITTVLYLNDNYVGGEITFPRQGISYKPEIGEVVVFPSNYTHPHIAEEIKEGTKYSCVTWFK